MKVVLVGRPNVGKSSIFNAIFKKPLAIISDKENTTRDIINKKYIFEDGTFLEFVDTGGIESLAKPVNKKDLLLYKAYEKTYKALQEASIILFVVDGSVMPTTEDIKLLNEIRKNHFNYIDIFLIINKVDNPLNSYAMDYLSLGIDKFFEVSAKKMIGIDALINTLKNYAKEVAELHSKETKIAVIGRPNVGKSSLINAMIDEKKLIVSEIPGTTIDSIDIEFTLNDQKYIFIDTAGLIKKSKIKKDSIEKFSYKKTENSIKKADICLFLIDSSQKITRQDMRIADMILENHKNCIVVINKWDLMEGTKKNITEEYIKYFEHYFDKLKWAPYIFVSAYTKKNINNLFYVINKLIENIHEKKDEKEIANHIKFAFEKKPHPIIKGKWCNLKKVKIQSQNPLIIDIKVSDASILRQSYVRYLKNTIYNLSNNLKGINFKLNIYDHKDNKVEI